MMILLQLFGLRWVGILKDLSKPKDTQGVG